MPDRDKRDYYERRWSSLKLERESFDPHWKELSDFVRPRRGRFFLQDRNKGTKRHNSIINSEATQALRVAVSGMLEGTMSPARPWFALETHNLDLMENQDNRRWLHKVENLLRSILNDGNFYTMAPVLLEEMLLFGTGAMSHVDDFDSVARFYSHTAGSYVIGQNSRFEVDTFGHEFEWSAEQIVREFGIDNVSIEIKRAIDTNRLDSWYPVRRFIEPNDEFRPDSPVAKNFLYRSVYYEPGRTGLEDRNKYLRVSGFREFPTYVPRWSVTGEDIYATDCPGMTSLGDVKQLQLEEKRKAQAIEKMVNPPLGGPPTLRNVPINSLPGGANIYDAGAGQELKPLYLVNPHIQELRLDMESVEKRIQRAFFNDLFLAISQMEGIQPRNQLDLIHRHEERLLQLGPVLQRVHTDFLNRMINRLFNQADRAGILPPAPAGLQGAELKIKFISTLAMAQRAVATQALDRVFAFGGNLRQLGWEDAGDKLDADQAIDEYGRAIGAAPTVVRSDEETAKIRAKRAQRLEMMQALEAGEQAANIAKTASEAKTDDDSVLSEVM